MKSKKTVDQLERMTSSVMRYLEGEEVEVWVDWDSKWFYAWIEPTWVFEDFCEEVGGSMLAQLENLNSDLAKLGVHQFYDLYSLNEWIKQFCGDNEPAEFYFDDWMNVCGA